MDKVEQAKKLAMDNYDSWGQFVIECMTDNEIEASLFDLTLEEWVKIREDVGGYFREIERTKF
jgi:hypothetical protein